MVALSAVVGSAPARSVAVVIGEAGVGKTALIRAGLSNCRTASGEVRLPPSPSMLPLAEVVGGLIRLGADPTSAGIGAYRAVLRPLLPSGVDDAVIAKVQPSILGEAVLRLWSVLPAPKRPVLVIEDVHWIDEQGWSVVESLLRRVGSVGASLVITTRPAGPWWPAIQRGMRASDVQPVILDPLADEPVRVMIAGCLGVDEADVPPGLTDRVAAAGGLPLLIEEVLTDLVRSGALQHEDREWRLGPGTVRVPASVAATTRAQLAGLPAPARRMVECAALTGLSVDTELVAAACGCAPDQLAELMAAAIGAGLIVLDSGTGTAAFRHDLVRASVVDGLLDVQRRDHARRLLHELGWPGEHSTGENGPDWARSLSDTRLALAVRLAAVADPEASAAVLAVSARRSLDRGLPLAAAEAAEAAARSVLPGDDAVAREVGVLATEALALSGEVDRALGAAARVDPLIQSPDAGHLRSRVAEATARAIGQQGDWDEALHRLAPVRGASEGPSTTALAALIALELGDDTAADSDARRVLAGGGQGAAACEAMEVLGRLARRGDLAEAQAWFVREAATAERAGLALWRARATHEAATVEQLRTLSTDRLYEARSQAETAGAPGLVSAVDFHLAAVHSVRFEPEPSLVAARRLLADSRMLGAQRQEAWAWILIGNAHAVAGRRTQAQLAGEQALALTPIDPEILGMAHGSCFGLPALLAEDVDVGLRQWRTAIEALRRVERDRAPAALVPVASAGHRARPGRRRRSPGPLRNRWISPARGPVCECALPARRRGRRRASGAAVEANRCCSTALAMMDQAPAAAGWHHLALRWAAPDAIAAGWGDPASWMAAATDWFAERRFAAVAGACRGLAHRAGARQRRRGRGAAIVPAPLDSLGVTAREMDVLLLVAEGLTNSQIAERLYLSPRTVKGYVEQLLAKTGANNRTQLVSRLAAKPSQAS